jgi:hypothetical protein
MESGCAVLARGRLYLDGGSGNVNQDMLAIDFTIELQYV